MKQNNLTSAKGYSKVIDKHFVYDLLNYERGGKCELRLYRGRDGHTLVIFSELPNNHGPQIANWVEKLATRVVNDYNLEPSCVTWLEHLPARKGEDQNIIPEDFDLMTFTWKGKQANSVEWRYLGKPRLKVVFHALGLTYFRP